MFLKSDLFASLPTPWPHDLRAEIAAGCARANRVLVVLDDDPTGTQSVFDVPVLCVWDEATLRQEFERGTPLFYVLTNSRALTAGAANELAREIGHNLWAASDEAEREFEVISRGDSTLRGHFPGEVEALAQGLYTEFDATLLVPAFFDGGRYSIGDVHYVQEGEALVEVAQTPFAQDKSFGFRNSNLRAWVEEKTRGRVRRAAVASLSLEELRVGGPEVVRRRLEALSQGQICVVNAAHPRDLEVLSLAWLASGKRFIARSAASLVPIRAGMPERSTLTAEELALPAEGGALWVAGSYVPKTTAQLDELCRRIPIERIELDVAALLEPRTRAALIAEALECVTRTLSDGRDALLCTSRALVAGADAAKSLEIGAQVSAALVEIVARDQSARCAASPGARPAHPRRASVALGRRKPLSRRALHRLPRQRRRRGRPRGCRRKISVTLNALFTLAHR